MERVFVRLLVPFAFVAAGVLAYEVAKSAEEAPSIAFQNRLVYGGLLFLLVFYGLLLLVLPLARAIFTGELPIELTTKGPRYRERELATSRKAAEELAGELVSMEERLEARIGETATQASAAAGAVRGEAQREVKRLDERIDGKFPRRSRHHRI